MTSGGVVAAGLAAIVAAMLALWRHSSARLRLLALAGMAVSIEAGALALQVLAPVILDTSLFDIALAAYLAALALDEIGLRGMLRAISERRFQRIAMSLGDGLACLDEAGRVTLWNPGAVAIFGRRPEEMAGRSLDAVCSLKDAAGRTAPFRIAAIAMAKLQTPGGHMMELEGRRGNGETFALEACLSAWQGSKGLQFGAVLRDISVRKREEARIKHLAEHDTLTDLLNRNALHDRLSGMLATAAAEGRGVALLLAGIDNFKQVNTMLGHSFGDMALRAIAGKLRMLAPPAALLARLGGDEFGIAIEGTDLAGRVEALCGEIAQAFRDVPVAAGGRAQRIRVSIGAATFPCDCATADELLGNAHMALSRAKTDGRGGFTLYEPALRERLEKRLALEAELVLAAERREFELFYQPQVDLRDGRIVGAEALIRWRHPKRGLVAPGEFMPVVHGSVLSGHVAAWVLETGCRQGRAWELAGHDLKIGINLSPSQIQSGDFAGDVAGVLARTGLSARRLKLEVTEDIMLADDEKARCTFEEIRALGVRMAFDDFGTGYGSLSYLKTFLLDELKIDKSFVLQLEAGSHDAAIVGSTIHLGHSLGLSVLAEGIETRATADLLVKMGCKEGQGYFFGKPMPAREFELTFLAAGKGGQGARLDRFCAGAAPRQASAQT